jgi:hypothetical protein
METMPFQPKNEKPYWQYIYDEVVDQPVGTTISHDRIMELTQAPLNNSRSAVYIASKHLLEDTNHSLRPVRGVGYEVISGMQIMGVAVGHQKKAKRQIKIADFETNNINTKELKPEEKKTLTDFMVHNSAIQEAFSSRLNRLEKANQVSRVAQAFSESEINELRKLIGK